MVRGAFDTLGIKVTKDKKAIKKAYSALVKQYHPEEHPEEWSRIHDAFQEAMEYAQGTVMRGSGFSGKQEETETEYREEEPEYEEDLQEEPDTGHGEDVRPESGYGEMFEDAHAKWMEKKSEKAHALAKRLDELIKAPMAVAVSEWKHFFAMEFLPGVESDELLMLFEAVQGNHIPDNAAKVIAATMIKRKELYQNSMEFNKASLANAIVNCIYQKVPKLEKKAARRKKRIKEILKEMLMGVAIVIVVLAAYIFVTSGESAQRAGIRKMVVQQLNEKYGKDVYAAEDIEIESCDISSTEIVAFKITEKEEYEAIAYVLGEKGGTENLFCFDRVQSDEIRQALEADVNRRTGRTDGKLYWNSAGGSGECIKDGYFHEKYGGNVRAFLNREAKVRETVTGLDAAVSGNFDAKNGKADYYLPHKDIMTIKQRIELREDKEDEKLTAALGQCAADYEMQICGIVLPGKLFEERMKQGNWEEGGIVVKSTIYQLGMYPPISPALMTGWYVCLPPYGQEYLEVENGMYSGKLVDMAEGVWGIENRLRSREGMPGGIDMPEMPEGIEFDYSDLSGETDLTGRLKVVKAPESLGISEAKGQKSVSFSMTGIKELRDDYCLIIDKEAYGIPDSGYQVMVTEYRDGNEETREQPPVYYGELRGDIGYNDSLDGEGYLFTGYPNISEGEKAPVLTVIF